MNYINQLPDECLLPIFALSRIGTICQVSKRWNFLGEHIKNHWLQTPFETQVDKESSHLQNKEIIWFNGNVGIEAPPFLKAFLILHFKYFESLWGKEHNFSYQEHTHQSVKLDDLDSRDFEQMVKVTHEAKGVNEESLWHLAELASRFDSPRLHSMCDSILAKDISEYDYDEESFKHLLNFFKEENLLWEKSQKAATKFLKNYFAVCISKEEKKFLVTLDALKDCYIKKLNFSRCGVYLNDKHLEPMSKISLLESLQTNLCYQTLVKLTCITSLDLGSCAHITNAGLTSLANLISLTSLDLSSCKKITDLRFLAKLTSLTSLNLSFCGVTFQSFFGGIEPQLDLSPFENLFSLKSLNLSNCSLSDFNLISLKNLNSLTSLNLNGCTKITDLGLTSLENLTSLTSLEIECFHNITDAGMESFRRLFSLTSLNLGGPNRITFKGLHSLVNLTSLTSLTYNNCLEIDLEPPPLENLTSLTSLKFQGFNGREFMEKKDTQLDSALPYITKLASLTFLDLGENRSSDAGLFSLAKLTSLSSLEIAGESFTATGLGSFTKLPSLKFLSLNCKEITDQNLPSLENLTSLTSLTIFDATITGDGLASFTKLNSLISLKLSSDRINDHGLSSIANLTFLKSLELRSKIITDVGLGSLSNLTSLSSLDLLCCKKITDTGLSFLSNLNSLISLKLELCEKISDTGLMHLTHLTSLTCLSLWGCKRITDEGLPHFTHLTSLTSLSVGSKKITASGLHPLIYLPSLKFLNLAGSNKIKIEHGSIIGKNTFVHF